MDRKSVSAAVLIVAASVFYPRTASRGGTESSPAPVPAAPAATKMVTPSTEGPWKPICDHFRREPPSDSPQSLKIDIDAKAQGVTATLHADTQSGEAPQPLANQYCLQLQEAAGATFRSMIVLAPDPELTHLSLDFDRTMESIVWAVADGGFQLESYWFPWQKPPDKEETDPDKRNALQKDQDKRLAIPGLLLFRESDVTKSDLLAVFVVGDRPNFGPSRVQFQAAIDGIHTLQNNNSLVVSIVGPSFSGSIEPLKRLIARYNCDRFFVVTGRATNQDAVVSFSGIGSFCRCSSGAGRRGRI